MIKVRFPPSPTGNLHVGSVRTALFNFLFAHKNNGKLLLRIENTDKQREVKDVYQGIYDSLKWLGLTWDEGPILQSDRLQIYRDQARLLLEKGVAYQDNGAIYLKTKKEGQTEWIDLIGHKQITFDNKIIEDFVILKSDGFPTYHLANVVDDHLMEITHIIRGEDILSSTPKHILLYNAFGWDLPKFAHLPVILATDRSKLSKRHGAIGILDFKKDGFLPQALVNYLALLGWTPPSGKEILSLQEMIKEFDLKDVHTASAIFDQKKLDWINGEYIRQMSDEQLTRLLQEFLVDHPAKDKIAPVVPLIKERIKKLADFIPLTHFFFTKMEYDEMQYQKLNIKNQKEALNIIIQKMEDMERPWKGDLFEQTFRQLADQLGLSATQAFQLIRVAISGQLVTPPLFESIKILGEEETIKRVKEAQNFLKVA